MKSCLEAGLQERLNFGFSLNASIPPLPKENSHSKLHTHTSFPSVKDIKIITSFLGEHSV